MPMPPEYNLIHASSSLTFLFPFLPAPTTPDLSLLEFGRHTALGWTLGKILNLSLLVSVLYNRMTPVLLL